MGIGFPSLSPAARGAARRGALDADAGHACCLAFSIDMIDLIDASCGEAAGRAVRAEAALRIARSACERGLLLHMIDSERLIFHFEGPDSGRLEDMAAQIAADAAMVPVTTAGGVVHIILSAGGAVGPLAGLGVRDLESLALAALTGAQRFGGGRVRVLAAEHGLADWYARAAHTLAEVRAAVSEDRLALVYQPVVDRSGATFYHECLMRVVTEAGGLLSPAEFVPVLEQMGAIGWFDHAVLERVLAELDRDSRAVLGCNISGQSISCSGWMAGTLERLTARPGLRHRLVIEITETAAIFDLAKASRHVAKLRALGVRVALDDFGVGFASFAHLRTLGVDIVKLDKSFIGTLSGAGGARGALDALDRVAHLAGLLRGLGFDCIVIEGVEGDERQRVLALADISHFQGFSFGVPSTYRAWRYDGAAPSDAEG